VSELYLALSHKRRGLLRKKRDKKATSAKSKIKLGTCLIPNPLFKVEIV
jgi:hypothetical protein